MKAVGRSDIDRLPDGGRADNKVAQRPSVVPRCIESDDQCTIRICDNLPAIPAISDAELDAIERYMGDILDMVLGGTVTPPIPDRDNRLS